MKSVKITGNVIVLIVVLLLWAFLMVGPSYAKETKKVAVLPFSMNAKEDLTFLQKGIFNMVSSRISYQDEVVVLPREHLINLLSSSSDPISITQEITEAKAKSIGANLKVDYVLFGSLTLYGNSMSLDVNMVDIKTNSPTLAFFRQAKEAGAVIPELAKIIQEINFKVFGRQLEEFQPLIARQNQMPAKGGASYPAAPINRLRTLLSVEGRINGVSTGDVDGDKKIEVVVIYDHSVEIFKPSTNGMLSSLIKLKKSAVTLKNISVDVADINQNGVSEIFVTRFSTRTQVFKSYVIEYNGNSFISKSEHYPWYFRAVKNQGGQQPALYAQRSSQRGPYKSKSVFKVESSQGAYKKGENLRVPAGFSLLSLAMDRSSENRFTHRVFTRESGHLVFFDDNGKISSVGEKRYGGSSLFFPLVSSNYSEDTEFQFFQPKNLFFDIDSDGRNELIVIRNKESNNYHLKKLRSFKTGYIEFLPLTESISGSANPAQKFDGEISCIEISDYDGDSKAELLVSVVKKTGTLFSRNVRSMIIAYDL